MTTDGFWGKPLSQLKSDFPFQEFDGTITGAEYKQSHFSDGSKSTSINLNIDVAQYEVEAKGMNTDTSFDVFAYYSMGGREFNPSDDGLEILPPEDGSELAPPSPRARASKLIISLRENTDVQMQGSSLKSLIGFSARWKTESEQGRNPNSGELSQPRNYFYAIGKPTGGANVNEADLDRATELLTKLVTELPNQQIRERDLAERVLEYQEEYSSDTCKLAIQSETIHSAILSGAIKRIDERTIGVASLI